jgi:hypothetical protein
VYSVQYQIIRERYVIIKPGIDEHEADAACPYCETIAKG